jgi:hypothetical protein
MWITTEVEINEREILDELDTQEILEELERRESGVGFETTEVTQQLVAKIYHLHHCEQVYESELNQLFWQVLGRI